MRYTKTKWDYFCDMMAATPGIAAIFGDTGVNCGMKDGVRGDNMDDREQAMRSYVENTGRGISGEDEMRLSDGRNMERKGSGDFSMKREKWA